MNSLGDGNAGEENLNTDFTPEIQQSSNPPEEQTDQLETNATFLEQAKIEITELHAQAMASCRTTIHKALEIGAKLTETKRSVGHGQWCTWVDTNLDFDVRTAQNYMRLHRNREAVLAKYEAISHLGVTDTYHALAKFPKPTVNVPVTIEEPDSGETFDEDSASTAETPTVEQEPHQSTGFVANDEEELFVGTFSAQEVEQLLKFIRSAGIKREAYQLLRAQGDIQRLKPTLQAKINPYLNTSHDDELDNEEPS